ncbi:unnamed protein product [Trichobilharzia szidati]|nr:unnamed protein product [Trichobilharzia szidati]
MGNQSSTSSHETESVTIEVQNDKNQSVTNIRYQSDRNTGSSNDKTGPPITVILQGVDPQNDPATRIPNISIRNTGSSNDKTGPPITVILQGVDPQNDPATRIPNISIRNTGSSNDKTGPPITVILQGVDPQNDPATRIPNISIRNTGSSNDKTGPPITVIDQVNYPATNIIYKSVQTADVSQAKTRSQSTVSHIPESRPGTSKRDQSIQTAQTSTHFRVIDQVNYPATNIIYKSVQTADVSQAKTRSQSTVSHIPESRPGTSKRDQSIQTAQTSTHFRVIDQVNYPATNIIYKSVQTADVSQAKTRSQSTVSHIPESRPGTSKRDQSIQTAQTSTHFRAIQTVNPPADASVQVDLLTRSQSEVTRTEPEIALEISNPPTSVDASVESVEQSGIREQPADAFNTLRIYLLNLLPISVLSDESSLKKLSHCLICMENYHIGDRVMGLPCFHMFHHRCLCTWTEENLQCPVCRIPIYIVN